MGIARQLLKTVAQRAYTRFMDRVGSKIVVGLADTSSDAPDAYYTPKRDLYRQMVDEGSVAAPDASDNR